MDSAERPRTHPVRILRHSFEPSVSIAEGIQGLLETPTSQQKLRFFATKIAVLDAANYYNSNYHEELAEVKNTFAELSAHIPITNDIRFKRLDEGHVRMAFRPSRLRLNSILSPFDTLPNVGEAVRTGKKVHHYLYTDIAISALTSNPERFRTGIGDMKHDIASPEHQHLYYFKPLAVVGEDGRISYTPKDEAIAADGVRRQSWEQPASA